MKEKVYIMNNNMNSNISCSQCGMINALNTKFCVKCGKNLQNIIVKNLHIRYNFLSRKD